MFHKQTILILSTIVVLFVSFVGITNVSGSDRSFSLFKDQPYVLAIDVMEGSTLDVEVHADGLITFLILEDEEYGRFHDNQSFHTVASFINVTQASYTVSVYTTADEGNYILYFEYVDQGNDTDTRRLVTLNYTTFNTEIVPHYYSGNEIPIPLIVGVLGGLFVAAYVVIRIEASSNAYKRLPRTEIEQLEDKRRLESSTLVEDTPPVKKADFVGIFDVTLGKIILLVSLLLLVIVEFFTTNAVWISGSFLFGIITLFLGVDPIAKRRERFKNAELSIVYTQRGWG